MRWADCKDTESVRLLRQRSVPPLCKALILAWVLSCSFGIRAQEPTRDLTRLSLEELMNVEVYTASKHVQKVEDAPSSVTIITADDIQHYGYRTLADVLRSVRGFYVNYDRNYSYVGVRGFAPPGDYNSRILLLLDGHRLNDNIYDEALVGTELPLDLDLVERIEIVRGPSSSLYGADAFFAVINIITKSRKAFDHGRVSTEIGSFGSYKGSFQVAETFSHNVEALLAGSAYDSHGPSRLYFPEFNTPQTNSGLARNADDDSAKNLLARIAFRDFTLESLAGTREKGIPTASFGSLFNDPRSRTTDSGGNVALTYDRELDENTSILGRVSYNRFSYVGYYAYSTSQESGSTYLNRDSAVGEWWGAEGQLRKRFFRKHDVTFGAEYRDNFRQDQKTYDINPYRLELDVRKDSKISAGFVQDEFRIHPRLILNAGIRYDHYSSFGGSTNPRIGLLFRATPRTAIKLLYGQAFRPPNVYELYYHDLSTAMANPALRPETIRTYEAVVDRYLGSHLQFSASGYLYRIKGLIAQVINPANGMMVFENTEKVHAKGLEFEAQGKWAKLETRASYSVQNSIEALTRSPLANSPRHLAKVNLLIPVVQDKLLLGAEGQYMSVRRTIAGGEIAGFGLVNFTVMSRKLVKGVDVSCTAYNLLDKRYSGPGGPEHVQTSLRQDGRSVRLKVSYSF